MPGGDVSGAHLTGRQKRYLRGLAHGLKPVVLIGKNGLTAGVRETIDDALAHHELVKVRFVEARDEKEEICETIDEELGSRRVGMIGHVAILYRPAEDPEKRKIRLPDRSES